MEEVESRLFGEEERDTCRKCERVRGRRWFKLWHLAVFSLALFLDSAKSELVGLKNDQKLIQCQYRCIKMTSSRYVSMEGCQGSVECSKCVSYCSLLIRKSHVKRKLVCERDSHLCNEGCRQACSFFGFMDNETFDINMDDVHLKKKYKKFPSKLHPFTHVERSSSQPIRSTESSTVAPSVDATTSARSPTGQSPVILSTWKISVESLEQRGPIVQAAVSWEELSPSPSAIFTPDPVLAYLGMANGKYRLHWSCPMSNLEGQLVTDSASATVSMWPDCHVLVNVELLGYNIQSPSAVVDTTVPSTTPVQERVASPADMYTSPIEPEPLWRTVILIAGGLQVLICLTLFLAYWVMRRSAVKKMIDELPGDEKTTISTIIIRDA